MASMFLNKTVPPTKTMLSDALGESYRYWEEIQQTLNEQYGTLSVEWKFYSASSGWTLKLLLKKRNLFFFSPCDGYFRIAFVFGDKAVAAVEKSNLPKKMIRDLKNAKRYVEGRGLRIDVKKRTQIKNIVTLVAIKLSN